MKKFLSLLAAVGLTATTASVVVSCQKEIEGQNLTDLAQKINAGQRELALANASLNPDELKDQIVTLLTQTLVKDYGMNEEGYFRNSKMQSLTVGALTVFAGGQIQEIEIETNDLVGVKGVIFEIENVQFNFQINFTFAN